ncbi:DUF2510 domain-containing protein [Diaminobutyricibacter tongyongensis]|uniref:DUF2510 domain-containing protein n=1 Tax=Leifsonia tongyongensis TaxID=1268043 RepID=A0A6L9XTM8_9MICO|nr:DUF2510 domain-containing protein [Diaminobutyricibacter tongyongensis]NEN04723.1 DUF2510 domain-containing protein [Diaminobutyricibacter tongyongensis]
MSEVETPSPAPGWYADPASGTQLRWWAGAEWTSHTQPFAPPVALKPVGAPTPEDLEAEAYTPFAGRQHDQAQPAAEQAPPRNRQAYTGRNFGILAVIVVIVTLIAVDLAAHIPGSDWAVYALYIGVVLAPGLAISGIVFSSIGLAKIRTRGAAGVAAAGLTLGIIFTFAPFWIGIGLGIILGLSPHAG